MNDHKRAKPDHPIHELLASRWSPYGFSDRPVSNDDLRSLFEAARWAPSSYNKQPWRYIVATKANPEEFGRLLSCLVDGNQAWAKAAPVLALGCTSLNFVRNGKPNAAAVHDLGLASANLVLEATSRGLFVHQMIGILPDKARELYRIPEGVQPLTGVAIGYVATPNSLPDAYKQRDLAPRSRRRSGRVCLQRPVGNGLCVGKTGTSMSDPSIQHLVDAALYVDDLDRAEAFYRNFLGLELIGKEPGRHVFFRAGQGVLLIFNPESTGKAGPLP